MKKLSLFFLLTLISTLGFTHTAHANPATCPNSYEADADTKNVWASIIQNYPNADPDQDALPSEKVYADNCPTKSNADQLDTDCDGVGDVCDNCKTNTNSDQSDTDTDGVGNACDNCAGKSNADQKDSDGDLIGDACDNCPAVSNYNQNDQNSNGVGDACDSTTPKCTDTDTDFESNGYTGNGGMDSCQSQTTVIEVACNKTDKTKSTYNILCAGGFICQTGNCVKDPNAPTTPPPPGGNNTKIPAGEENKDWDKDGIPNISDNCPLTPNPDQKDTDNNGYGDACDPGNPGNTVKEEACKPADPNAPKPDCKTTTPLDNRLNSPSTTNLYAVTGYGDTLWAGGEGGNLLRRLSSGTVAEYKNWHKLDIKVPNKTTLPTLLGLWENAYSQKLTGINPLEKGKADITSVWAPSDSTLLVGTVSGFLFRWNANQWNQVSPQMAPATYGAMPAAATNDWESFGRIYGVYGKNSDNFWVVGANGLVRHFGKEGWEHHEIPDHETENWRAVYVSGSTVWIVSDEGTIMRYVSQALESRDTREVIEESYWEEIQIASRETTLDDATIERMRASGRFSERDIEKMISESRPRFPLRTVWSDGTTTFVGGKGGIWKLDAGDTKFYPNYQSPSPDETILQINGTAAEDLLAVGNASRLLRRTGEGWSAIDLPYPNTLTGIWSDTAKAHITAINGTLYEYDPANQTLAKPLHLMTSQISREEGTRTFYSALQGKMDEDGNITATGLALSGDDLSLYTSVNSLWTGLYSDEKFLPFPLPGDYKNLARHDFLDLARLDDGSLWALGSVDKIVTIKNGSAQSLALSEPAATSDPTLISDPTLNPDAGLYPSATVPEIRLQSIRPGIAGTLLASGPLGLYSIDTAALTVSKLKPAGSNSVAITPDGQNIWMAASSGVLRSENNWTVDPWSPVLSVMDLAAIKGYAAAIGTDAVSAFDPNTGLMPSLYDAPVSHFTEWVSNKWAEVTPLPFTGNFLRLKPFAESIDIPLMGKLNVRGTVLLGSGGLIQARWGLKSYNWFSANSKSKANWHDGTYSFKSESSVGLTEIKSITTLNTLGVGSHNTLQKTQTVQTCKLPVTAADVAKSAWEFIKSVVSSNGGC